MEALLALSGTLTKYLTDKQLLDAGQSSAIAESLKNAQTTIYTARQIRNNSNAAFDSNSMPNESDKNLRD